MESPFLFGKLASGKGFVNRVKELNALSINIDSGINTLLISNRRLGKSSLVEQVALKKQSAKLKFVTLDLFSITTEKEFYEALAKGILESTNSRIDQIAKSVSTFLSKFSPSLAIGEAGAAGEFNLGLKFQSNEEYLEDVLDLTEKVAQAKNIKLVVCLDEFQSIGNFKNTEQFQQKLRAKWQRHKNTTYILYGSKRHVLLHFFENKKMPFYKFGDLMLLNKIDENEWITFIQESFKKTKKEITKEAALKIVRDIYAQSYYVQQLAHETWLVTRTKASEKEVNKAIENLITKNDILYRREIEHLSPTQIGFLKALINGEENFHSSEVMSNYRLGSSANVTTIKRALENKEVIDFLERKPEFIDAGFKLWLRQRYFSR